ncbi:hypothetical protein BAnh1_11730 [Bartonella australis AUST/NH1]|uniref:DUF883 domain-containing protein n=1 Tax=Bartonella australis (strain Aust/NH1) TaxID=1094489 RepID=M1P5C6_BARAA|nr:hypothetical protein [Bartonella australis]AGF75040.1 hypothetical protein BAnh1_11730 [Bartonella australis AUST/NH1]
MCIFSPRSKDTKIKKRIAQLKNELAAINRWHSDDNSWSDMSDTFDAWKQKGRHALHQVNKHTEKLKQKVEKNPKTTFALTVAIALAGFLIMRKN